MPLSPLHLSLSQPTPPPKPAHLIIICCHGIWNPPNPHSSTPALGLEEEEWLIAPFQRDETPTFFAHIRAGLYLLASDAESILVLSGGPTRKETRRSEARSYLELCEAWGFWGILDGKEKDSREGEKTEEIGERGKKNRVFLEERALDSFHNILFSLTLFHSITGGSWPHRFTIISNEFKRARFLDLHVPALRLSSMMSLARVEFIGIDPGYMVPDNGKGVKEQERDTTITEAKLPFSPQRTQSVHEGERKNGYEPWKADPLGKGNVLAAKRKGRNPWGVEQGFFVGDGSDGEEWRVGKWPWEE